MPHLDVEQCSAKFEDHGSFFWCGETMAPTTAAPTPAPAGAGDFSRGAALRTSRIDRVEDH